MLEQAELFVSHDSESCRGSFNQLLSLEFLMTGIGLKFVNINNKIFYFEWHLKNLLSYFPYVLFYLKCYHAVKSYFPYVLLYLKFYYALKSYFLYALLYLKCYYALKTYFLYALFYLKFYHAVKSYFLYVWFYHCYEKLFSLNKSILQNFLSKKFLQIDLVDIFGQSKKKTKQCQSLGLEFRKIIIEDGGRV